MTDRDSSAGSEATYAPSPLRARCPRCGKGKLYSGLLDLPKSCSVCGLDYSGFDVGDGATVFVILIVGAIVTGSALLVEVAYQPPLWVHAALWLPSILILSLGLLRLIKTWLIVQQYKHRAAEARRAE